MNAIARLEGVDLLFVGPTDLSVVLGVPVGQADVRVEVDRDDFIADATNTAGVDALKALGIIEPGVNLADQVKRLSTGSVTAFYDVKANELVVKGGQLTPFVLKSIVR